MFATACSVHAATESARVSVSDAEAPSVGKLSLVDAQNNYLSAHAAYASSKHRAATLMEELKSAVSKLRDQASSEESRETKAIALLEQSSKSADAKLEKDEHMFEKKLEAITKSHQPSALLESAPKALFDDSELRKWKTKLTSALEKLKEFTHSSATGKVAPSFIQTDSKHVFDLDRELDHLRDVTRSVQATAAQLIDSAEKPAPPTALSLAQTEGREHIKEEGSRMQALGDRLNRDLVRSRADISSLRRPRY